MQHLPSELRYNMAGYLPPQSGTTRRLALKIDPYDPRIITEMLELGLDPMEVVAKERLRQREERRIRSLPSFPLAQLLYRYGGWYAEDRNDGSALIQIYDADFPMEELQNLGYTIIPRPDVDAIILSRGGDDIYRDLIEIDTFFFPLRRDDRDTYDTFYAEGKAPIPE